MAHESFEHPGIARLMNENFINIKVDREERPDVDRLYMAFVQATTGSGGWPMSVWITPEGKPFFGGTYFPPEDRYGRAGFPSLLAQISALWREDKERVEREGARVMAALQETTRTTADANFKENRLPLQRAFASFAQSFDEREGGFGSAPKFPRPSVINFLLRYATPAENDDANKAREMALFTLRKMAAGGMRDHLGGGFHRYSVDEYWHVPHFEKMLYDQAQLATSYVEAWQITHDPFYEKIARETLDYVLRDMTHAQGGFFSAEDADSFLQHGGSVHAEGAFYVWTAEEIFDVLPPEQAHIFSRHYGVEENGNAPAGTDPHGEFGGKNILIQREESEDESLAASRAALLRRRNERPRPHLDDKILTAWNGLMISAFAKAGAAFSEPRYLDAAARAARFIREHLHSAASLLRSWRDGASDIKAFAEDYAFLIQALLDLYEADFDEKWLQWAVTLQAKQDALFWDEAGGSYFSSVAGDPLLSVRMKEDYDGAEPSANSISALNLLRFGRMFNDDKYSTCASRVIAACAQPLERAPTAVPQMLVALDLQLAPPAQAVVAGQRESADVRKWIQKLHANFSPRLVRIFAGGLLSKKNPELISMHPIGNRAALYLCENFACQIPQTLP